MAEFVSHSDYDWFTPADLSRVIDAIHALPDWTSVVLVGGQSLTAWAEYYKIELPPFEGRYLTIDADFLGTKTEAEVIARELGESLASKQSVADFQEAFGQNRSVEAGPAG